MTPSPLKHLRASDLRGAARLVTEATLGVADIAEGVHRAVSEAVGLGGDAAPGRTRGLTGWVYRRVRGATRGVGSVVDAVLDGLGPWLEVYEGASQETSHRTAFLAALNGVLGDHLGATGNPLATPMTLRYRGEPLHAPAVPPASEVSGRVLLLVHGLCMNDRQWDTWHEGRRVNHGEAIAAALGYTPLYLRYNSGVTTAENGRALAALLEHLLACWPRPIEELAVVAHSMGGLVARSTLYYAERSGLRWPERLRSVVFLGTPHHGAPLEQAGVWVEDLWALTPFTGPFARLGRLRSDGITDLRFGHVRDEDWESHDHRFHRRPDTRRIVPLPEGVACYALAATTATRRSLLADRLVGDGLVPLRSALGHHDDPSRDLRFPPAAQRVVYRTSHLALLRSPEVTQQLVAWMTPTRSLGR